MLSRRELFIQEMQMLTGVVTDDYEYLLYLLVKPSLPLREEKVHKKKETTLKSVSKIESLDDWFEKLEEI